jgi:hypothetical protein
MGVEHNRQPDRTKSLSPHYTLITTPSDYSNMIGGGLTTRETAGDRGYGVDSTEPNVQAEPTDASLEKERHGTNIQTANVPALPARTLDIHRPVQRCRVDNHLGTVQGRQQVEGALESHELQQFEVDTESAPHSVRASHVTSVPAFEASMDDFQNPIDMLTRDSKYIPVVSG